MQEAPQRLEPRPWSRLVERVVSAPAKHEDRRRALPVVLVAATLAISSLLLVAESIEISPESAFAVGATLAAIGVLADFLSFYAQGKSVVGSIALIPLSSTLLVAPDIRGLTLVACAQVVTEVFKRRRGLKFVFNVSQVVAGFGAGLIVYSKLGGVSFGSLEGSGFFESARSIIMPACALVLTVILVNTMCVSAVVAATSGQNFLRLWYDRNRVTAGYSVFHVILTFYTAWLAQNLGVLGTAGMVVPLIAVRQLLRTTAELTGVTEELLDLIVAAIEARDPYTSGHSKRVARASKIIAKAIGLKPESVERVGIAALLHDVGKIDERFAAILTKEGRLTQEEWALMKLHPVRGAELVGLLSSLKDIVPAVRHHHESWDGTGYPDALRGADIPLASRIIMFADTLDAITTDRPYRKALSADEARKEFVRFRGLQFDPDICDRVIEKEVWDELYSAATIPRDEVGVIARKLGPGSRTAVA